MNIPNRSRRMFHLPLSLLLTAALLVISQAARAVNYAGNANTSFGGAVGNGVLSVTDDGTNITFNLQRGSSGSLNDQLVVYVDTGVGGFADTSGFTDTGDGSRVAISGYNGGSSRSTLTFTNGFRPSYAVAISGGYASLFGLVNGGSHNWITGTGQGGGSSANFTLTISATQLGLTNGAQASIRLFGTYLSSTAWRSQEAIAGNDFSTATGYVPIAQTAFVTYRFAAPPAPTYNVTFKVDMSLQIANATFNPNNGDTVSVAGTFQTNAWAGFQLAPSVGNTNIYVGTYPDQNPTNTVEQFKFNFYSVSGASSSWEFGGALNRAFTLTGGGQTLPVVYFNDIYPSPSATTNNLSVSIDMGPQIYLGNFDPTAMQIEAFGTFSNPQWSSGFILTNNPTAANSNVYSGTIPDGNYPGSFEQFKFVMVNNGTNTYESGNNRYFFTPTNAGALPLAYFNNISAYGAAPITFQVDMTVPLASGAFVPGSGDTVSAAGTFQTNVWTAGSCVLTQSVANPHIYLGTFIDKNQPGAYEQFKYVTISGDGSTTNWETITPRSFSLGTGAYTNPVVFWNNVSTNQVWLVPTMVTFTVDMLNAVDLYGNAFDSNNDWVVVNGDFLNPQWPNFWQDPFVTSDGNAQYILQTTDNRFYTGTFTIPAGQTYEMSYKYGIVHANSPNGTQFNTNCDNEAGFAQNHVRYVRAPGTYSLPTDIFGLQRSNAPAATEPIYGTSIGGISAGHLPISWLGFSGTALQTSTNLSGNWQNVPGTDGGVGSTNWPVTGPQRFFRYPIPPQ